MDESESILRNSEELLLKLRIDKVQGSLYSLFHHTNIESFAKMVSGSSLWLSRVDKMNDGTEIFSDANRTYAFCFTSVPTENVGTWVTYGVPRKDAIRVRFSGKALHDICVAGGGNVSVNPIIGDKIQEKSVLGAISLQRIGYVSRTGTRIHISDTVYELQDCSVKSREDVLEKFGSYIKLSGWQYEREVRLVVRLSKSIDAEKVRLYVPDVIKGILTYKSRRRKDSDGMPSVIIGPWGGCKEFVSRFNEVVGKENLKISEVVGRIMQQVNDKSGLIRESEFKWRIRLGSCDRCKCKQPCECAYYEGGVK